MGKLHHTKDDHYPSLPIEHKMELRRRAAIIEKMVALLPEEELADEIARYVYLSELEGFNKAYAKLLAGLRNILMTMIIADPGCREGYQKVIEVLNELARPADQPKILH
jgi:hypothetical protein